MRILIVTNEKLNWTARSYRRKGHCDFVMEGGRNAGQF